MTTVSKSFTAAGFSTNLFQRMGDSFTWAVSGTFVGTVVLERSGNGGATWEPVIPAASATGAATGTHTTQFGGEFRWHCTAFTSGTIVCTMVDVVDTISEIRDSVGNLVIGYTEGGVNIDRGAIDGTPIGASSASTGAFTTLTASGTITVGDGTGTATFAINGRGTPNASKDFNFKSVDVTKWNFRMSGDATGSDAGDDLFLTARTDLGATIDNVLSMTRISGGSVTLSRPFKAASTVSLTGIENSLTAAAGGTQAGALALSATKTVHRVTTVTSGNDSVILPAGTAGLVHIVINDAAANSLQVFAALTETIDEIASATGIALAAGKRAIFICYATGLWSMIKGA